MPARFEAELHYLGFVTWAVFQVLTWRPSVVYLSDAWSYPIGLILRCLPGLKLVMHEHDTPARDSTFVLRFIWWCRSRLIRKADLCVCPQAARADAIEQLSPKKLLVVHNCPSFEDIDSKEVRECKGEDVLGLWFHGSIVPSQLPLHLIAAMKDCGYPVRLSFAGYETIGHPGYVQEILDEAERLGIGDRVRYAGTIPSREQLLQLASEQHVGLALFEMEFREPMVGASNKPFDYLASRLVLLVPAVAEWNQFFVENGCAIGCDTGDEKSISEKLRWCFENLPKLSEMNSRGLVLLRDEWNYEKQFQPVLDFLVKGSC